MADQLVGFWYGSIHARFAVSILANFTLSST